MKKRTPQQWYVLDLETGTREEFDTEEEARENAWRNAQATELVTQYERQIGHAASTIEELETWAAAQHWRGPIEPSDASVGRYAVGTIAPPTELAVATGNAFAGGAHRLGGWRSRPGSGGRRCDPTSVIRSRRDLPGAPRFWVRPGFRRRRSEQHRRVESSRTSTTRPSASRSGRGSRSRRTCPAARASPGRAPPRPRVVPRLDGPPWAK